MGKQTITVSKLNSYIAGMFSDDYVLKNLSVSGEASNVKYHSSGHIYFSLKDASSQISAVMFKGNRNGLKFQMKDGDKVIITGSVQVYERSGQYQIYAREIKPDGEGELYLQFEKLKQELSEMGMFSDMYKKPIPQHARRVGIVTAPTGAAVRDIIQISKRRNPYVELILYPALVQGDGAAESIIKGIQVLDSLGLDTIIVGRGGGSIEDLWAFNEEVVARAIFDANTPIISAVGHEIDTTISDYVADLRAPTPSAAAELAVFDYAAYQANLTAYYCKLQTLMDTAISSCKYRQNNYLNSIRHLSPENSIRQNKMYLADLENRLQAVMDRRVTNEKNRMAVFAEKLDGLSPAKKLSQGYSYAVDANDKNISSVRDVSAGDQLSLYVTDGKIITTVNSIS